MSTLRADENEEKAKSRLQLCSAPSFRVAGETPNVHSSIEASEGDE